MLRTEPMQKVRVVCLDKDKRSVVVALHNLGTLDLRQSRLKLEEDKPSESLDALSECLVRTEGAIQILERLPSHGKKEKGKPSTLTHKEEKLGLEALLEHVRSLKALDEIYAGEEKLKAIRSERKSLMQAEAIAEMLSGTGINFSDLSSSYISIRAFTLDKKQIEEAEAALRHSVKSIDIRRGSARGEKAALLVAYDKKKGIDSIVKKYKMTELNLAAEHLEDDSGDALKHIRLMLSKGSDESKAIDAHLDSIKQREYNSLLAVREMLNVELERSRCSSIFKKTESLFVVEGWVPKKMLHGLKEAVSKTASNRYLFEELEEHEELAPTLVKRPGFLKSFDYIMEFLSVPRSDEIDPTWIFIVSFPIFYGLMVSDVGYGILSLLFATYIKRITDPEGLVHNTASIWQLGSLSVIFFGFLTNQYFGLQFNQYFTTFKGLDWFKDITTITLITVFFGLAQIILGLIFSFVNNYRRHKRALAAAKFASIILIISGSIAISGGLFHLFSAALTLYSGILALVSLLITMALSGHEAGEVPSLIAHILSYSRIMGFGMVSVYIAFLIDMAFTPTLSHGILLFVAYMLIFILLHFLNMIVSIFEGIVQGIRLNFVEFFTKFYEGGGVKYKPFSYRRIYTKE